MLDVLRPLGSPGARSGRLRRGRRHLRRGRRRLRRDRPPRRRPDPPGAQGRRPGQRPDPLQRRLAGDGGLGHGAGAHLPRPRRGRADPRLGRRDPAAQPGLGADRLGARPARRAPHRHRRQRRRPPDAPGPGRPLHRGLRPHRVERRRLQQDRHLSEGARRPRHGRALLRRPAVLHRRLVAHHRRRHPDRGARGPRGRPHPRPQRGGRSRLGRDSPRRLRVRQLRLRRDARRGWSPPWSPSAASAPPRPRA